MPGLRIASAVGAGCPGCRVDFILPWKAPGWFTPGTSTSLIPGVTAAFDNIPLVVLGEGEKLVIEGFATKRIGSDHAKWNSGTLCGYKNLPSIEISDACNGCGKCVKECPRQALIQDDGGRAKATNTLNCSLCKLCIEVCEAGAVKIILPIWIPSL